MRSSNWIHTCRKAPFKGYHAGTALEISKNMQRQFKRIIPYVSRLSVKNIRGVSDISAITRCHSLASLRWLLTLHNIPIYTSKNWKSNTAGCQKDYKHFFRDLPQNFLLFIVLIWSRLQPLNDWHTGTFSITLRNFYRLQKFSLDWHQERKQRYLLR